MVFFYAIELQASRYIKFQCFSYVSFCNCIVMNFKMYLYHTFFNAYIRTIHFPGWHMKSIHFPGCHTKSLFVYISFSLHMPILHYLNFWKLYFCYYDVINALSATLMSWLPPISSDLVNTCACDMCWRKSLDMLWQLSIHISSDPFESFDVL